MTLGLKKRPQLMAALVHLICSALRPPALVSASRGLWGCKKSTRDHIRIAIATAATNNARMVAALSRLPSIFGLSDIDRRPYFGGCSSTKAALLLQGPQLTS
jgi:hypothetical protein